MTGTPRRDEHRTVSRIVRILEFVAAGDGVSRTDVVDFLDAPRSSVQGFLRGLIAEGYVRETGAPPVYRLGHAAHALLLSRESSLIELSRPVRERLVADIDETITLGVPVADSVVYLESLTPRHPVCYRAPIRVRRPQWPTSCGKIFLAEHDDPVAHLSRSGIGTDLPAGLSAEFAEIRRTGSAYNIAESMTDVSAVALRFECDGVLAAAVSIAGPSGRVGDRLPEYARHARDLLGNGFGR